MTDPSYSYGRQMFRFRLPWMINSAPAAIPAPSEPQTAAPSEPQPRTTTTTIPIQQRPSGTPVPTPSLPPPEPQLKPPAASPTRTQPQPPSPSPSPSSSQSKIKQMSPQPRVQPQTASSSLSQLRSELQSQITPPRPQAAASQPPTPSRTTIQSRTPLSQARIPGSQQPSSPKTNPKPSTPSSTTSPLKEPKTPPRTESSSKQFQSPPSEMVSQPPSPSRTPKTKTQSSLTSPTPTQRSIASPGVASKPQSPARLASQPPAKTSSPLTTSHGTTLQTASHVSPSLVKQKKLQSQAQASSQSPSPSKSSASQPESSSSKAAKNEPALSVPLAMKSQPLAEVSSIPASQPKSQIHKQETTGQKKTQSPRPSTLPAVVPPTPPEKPATELLKSNPIDLKDHPKFETETEKEKQKTESSTSEKKTITADAVEPKLKSSIGLSNMVKDSDEQHRGLLGAAASQEKSNQLSKQAHGDENGKAQSSKMSTVIPGKSINTMNEPHPKPSVKQGEKTSLQKEIKDDISRFVHKLGSGHQMQPTDNVSVITLTGENKGASMHVGAEMARKEGSVPINRGYKLNQDDNTDLTTDGESSSRGRKSSNTKENTESLAYINSNVQSINNSIMFTSSVSERNPGVKFVSRSSNPDTVKTNGKEKSVEAHKAEFNVTQPQKLTYEPTIRRRCLRGLFLEPESDPDNPDKPRRHGCRVNCNENEKCNDNKNGASETW